MNIPVSPTEKVYGTEEALAKGILELLKSGKTKILSDLDDEEILNLSALFTLSETVKCKTIENFCDNFLQLRVSRFRLGRREVVSIASYTQEPDRKKVKSIKDLFAGIR
jgi:hypothetical protein